MNAKPTYSYDSECERLAEYFLGTYALPDVQELAQAIQDEVEGWLAGKIDRDQSKEPVQP